MLVSSGPTLASTRVQWPSSSYSISTVGDSTIGSSPHSHTTSGSGYPAKIDGRGEDRGRLQNFSKEAKLQQIVFSLLAEVQIKLQVKM